MSPLPTEDQAAPDHTLPKAPGFRHVPAEGIQIGISPNGVRLAFAVEDDPGKMIELVRVHLSHVLAERLRDTLASAIENWPPPEQPE